MQHGIFYDLMIAIIYHLKLVTTVCHKYQYYTVDSCYPAVRYNSA